MLQFSNPDAASFLHTPKSAVPQIQNPVQHDPTSVLASAMNQQLRAHSSYQLLPDHFHILSAKNANPPPRSTLKTASTDLIRPTTFYLSHVFLQLFPSRKKLSVHPSTKIPSRPLPQRSSPTLLLTTLTCSMPASKNLQNTTSPRPYTSRITPSPPASIDLAIQVPFLQFLVHIPFVLSLFMPINSSDLK